MTSQLNSASAKNIPHTSYLKAVIALTRFNKPIGIWLLMWPCFWSIAAANPGIDITLLILFAIGSALMRAAGCTFNDILDRDLDRHVERTKNRPLASGRLTRRQAAVVLILLLSVSFIILLQLNSLTIALGVASLLPVALYPMMKRWTRWPQAFLGITFNWGTLMGWTAVTGSFDPLCLLLYASGFFWTLGFDTIYGLQDREDDLIIGIKSTAITLRDKIKFWIAGFYTLTISGILTTGYILNKSPSFYGILVIATALLLWQVLTLDTNNPKSALQRFKNNQWVGGIIFLSFALS